MKSKDETFQIFKNFREKVETETGEKVKVFRTDRGREILSNEFTIYCKNTRLERHYTSLYSPQKNGLVERRNRTVLEMVRCNLKTMEMPDLLWGEPVTNSAYVLNRSHTKALKNETPYEMWTGRKPHIEHLRVFGCVAHMKIAESHLKKLEDRSVSLIHLGIEKGSKGYRLLDPNIGKLYVSRDVVFEEQRTWKWEKSVKIKAMPCMILPLNALTLMEGYTTMMICGYRTHQTKKMGHRLIIVIGLRMSSPLIRVTSKRAHRTLR